VLTGNPRKRMSLPIRPPEEQPVRQSISSESSTTISTGSTSPPANQTPAVSESPPSSSTSLNDATAIIVHSHNSPEPQNKPRDVFAPQIRDFLAAPGLAEHRYIILSQYSFLRAFVHNALTLDLDPALFTSDDSISPWTIFNPYPAPSKTNMLVPTPIQLSTFHHPYIDIIASPRFRENILLAGLDDEQEDRFCHALHDDGFTIWGSQPWNPMGWEASQQFVDLWGWMMDEETIQCSNFWRFERGDLPLVTPAVVGEILGEVA
jgi:hypothetical protein